MAAWMNHITKPFGLTGEHAVVSATAPCSILSSIPVVDLGHGAVVSVVHSIYYVLNFRLDVSYESLNPNVRLILLTWVSK